MGAPAVTVNGVLISLGTSDFLVGDKTETFALVSTGSSIGQWLGLGAVIMSGVGGVGGGPVSTGAVSTAGNTSEIVPFRGVGSETNVGRIWGARIAFGIAVTVLL